MHHTRGRLNKSIGVAVVKVAFVTTDVTRFGGGLFDASKNLAKAIMRSHDCELRVFGGASAGYETDIDTWAPVEVVGQTSYEKAFAFFPRLINDIVKWHPDIIHAHGIWQYLSLGTHLAKKKTDAKLMVSTHGMLDPWILNKSRLKKRMASIVYQDRQLAGADCLHALSESEYISYRQYGLTNPICTIPNGVLVEPLKESSDFFQWPEGAADRNILLYLGRIHPKKGLDNLLDAWSIVSATEPSSIWALVIAGWGDVQYTEMIQKRVSRMGNAFFIGPLFGEDKKKAYRNAAAFILPSFSEGLPLVVLEAWAESCPVLMTDHCNLPVGFKEGAALRIHTGNLVYDLGKLFAIDDQELRLMGLRGSELVNRVFSWDVVAAQMIEVYSWLLGEIGRPISVR